MRFPVFEIALIRIFISPNDSPIPVGHSFKVLSFVQAEAAHDSSNTVGYFLMALAHPLVGILPFEIDDWIVIRCFNGRVFHKHVEVERL
jgi:hypothetical protein